MKNLPSSLLIILFALNSSYAQFGTIGDKLKRKAGEVMQQKALEKTDEKQAGYDTTTFNYAIAFLDKAESFENKQEGERAVKAAAFLLKDANNNRTDLEEARDLYESGRLWYNQRGYFVSEKYLLAAMVAYQLIGENENPVFLKAVGTLALLYNNMGRYDLAESFNEQALDGWEYSVGKNSPGYAAEYNNKAVIAFNQGEYNKAEKLFNEALPMIQNTEGDQSVPFAIANNNLGILYQYMGRSEDALKKINVCLGIAEKELREKSGTYIQLMTNKALVLQENKQYDEAEATYQSAIDLQTSRLKLNRKSDPDYAHLLNNMASLYLQTGRVDKVEPLLRESHDIYVSKFTDEHPTTAGAKADLGNFYRSQGRYDEALPLLEKALESRKSMLGNTHANTMQSVEDLAVVKWLKGDISEASGLFDEVMNYSISFINDFFAPLSEVEKTKYWEKLKNRFLTYYNFAFSNADTDPTLLGKALNYRLVTKGLLLNASTKIKNSILVSNDEDLIKLYTQWQDQKRTLAVYYSFSREEIAQQKVNIDSLERAANLSERQLSEKSTAFATAFVSKDLDYKQVQSKLKPGEVVVEMIHHPVYTQMLTGDYRYAAVIIKPTGNLEFSMLDNGGQLDKRYYAYYNNVVKNKLKDDFSYEQYWARIAPKVANHSTVYFSPDGVYSQINVNTLKSPSGQYLVQQSAFKLIGNPADLLEEGVAGTPAKDAFLLGFPTYGSSEIVPLPGTQKEVQQIKSMLVSGQYRVEDVMQQNATETIIKKVNSPRIMHVATHGYFMEDIESKGNVFGVQVEYAKNNPLLRSGLMLAGASNDYEGGSFTDDDNGILTAYEAMNLQLDKTDLVVLSACETGKGDVRSGEGVYGLQRAFVMAGADKMVMSLWKVDDAATQQLMTGFYKNWVQSGQELSVAFRNAQLQLMKTYPDPYYWGAFVMVGR